MSRRAFTGPRICKIIYLTSSHCAAFVAPTFTTFTRTSLSRRRLVFRIGKLANAEIIMKTCGPHTSPPLAAALIGEAATPTPRRKTPGGEKWELDELSPKTPGVIVVGARVKKRCKARRFMVGVDVTWALPMFPSPFAPLAGGCQFGKRFDLLIIG